LLKESENPPVCFPEDVSVKDFAGTWWVAHTKSRNEKALAWQMLKLEIPYFLPMSRKVTRKSGRTFRSLLPLFMGYVFFCGDEDQRIKVLRTNRVANIIDVPDQIGFVNDIVPIERVLQHGQAIEPHNYIHAGQKCRVIAGPLMGYEAIVEKVGNTTRLILQVDMLGQATSVEIENDMVELIED
jgi:transcription antitermination factor NusG